MPHSDAFRDLVNDCRDPGLDRLSHHRRNHRFSATPWSSAAPARPHPAVANGHRQSPDRRRCRQQYQRQHCHDPMSDPLPAQFNYDAYLRAPAPYLSDDAHADEILNADTAPQESRFFMNDTHQQGDAVLPSSITTKRTIAKLCLEFPNVL